MDSLFWGLGIGIAIGLPLLAYWSQTAKIRIEEEKTRQVMCQQEALIAIEKLKK